MSYSRNISRGEEVVSNPIAEKLNVGILGLVLGAGMMFLAMHYFGYRLNSAAVAAREKPTIAVPPALPEHGFADPAAALPGIMGGGPNGKRILTSLVGKLELCSRDNLRLHIEFDADQAAKLAAQLAPFESAEMMTLVEAESHVAALEALLTSEQNEVLSAIGLPRSGGAPAMGMPAAPPDENPFAEGMSQQRLHDLLGRLKLISANQAPASEQP